MSGDPVRFTRMVEESGGFTVRAIFDAEAYCASEEAKAAWVEWLTTHGVDLDEMIIDYPVYRDVHRRTVHYTSCLMTRGGPCVHTTRTVQLESPPLSFPGEPA